MARLLIFGFCAMLAGCTPRPHAVLLAFPHGGDAGADGIRADATATAVLKAHGFDVEHLDLDGGVQNPHEDEGTDDERAVAAAANIAAILARSRAYDALIVGPTRAIADAVPWRRLGIRVVAVAPLVRDVPCVCPTEREVRKTDRGVVIESTDGLRWSDGSGRVFRTLSAAKHDGWTFDVVARSGRRYRVPVAAVPHFMSKATSIDLRGFAASDEGLTLRPMDALDVEDRARTAAEQVGDSATRPEHESVWPLFRMWFLPFLDERVIVSEGTPHCVRGRREFRAPRHRPCPRVLRLGRRPKRRL